MWPSLWRGLLVAALALGALVRVAALPLPGTEDVDVWKIWSYNASLDVTSMYGIGGDPPVRGVLHYSGKRTTVDYPPVALYELGLLGLAYRAAFPGYPNDWRLVAALKVPGLVAGCWLAVLIHRTVLRSSGQPRLAAAATLAYWLNPAILLNGEILGYLDPLLLLPAIAALLALHDRRFGVAGLWLAVAALTKPQGMLVVPAALLAAWQLGARAALLRTVGVAAASSLAIFAPFIAAGALPNAMVAFWSFIRRDILSAYAANVWWIVNWLERAWHMLPQRGFPGAYLVPVPRIMALSTFMDLGWPNPRPAATTAIVLIVGWAMWRQRRSSSLGAHAALAAFTVDAFYTLGIAVHEHHLILAVPLLVLAAATDRRYRPVLVAVSVVVALAMNIFYGLGRGVGWAVPRTLTILDVSVVNAAVGIAVFLWFTGLIVRSDFDAPHPTDPQDAAPAP